MIADISSHALPGKNVNEKFCHGRNERNDF